MSAADEQAGNDTPALHDNPVPATRVLMMGCGQMGGALLARWQRSGNFAFTVVSPSGTRTFGDGVSQVRAVHELAGQSFDIIVIAVKPQTIADVLPDYLHLLGPAGVFVSIAAGFSCASLSSITSDAPTIRVMPNLPVSLGKGVSGLYANQEVGTAQRQLVESLMRPTGHLLWVASEDELDRLTALAGSGPGYAFEIARCWVQAGESLGFTREEARALVLKTLEGTVDLALACDEPLEELRERVTSKNGTTHAGLVAMNGDSQLGALLSDTVLAAYARARELR